MKRLLAVLAVPFLALAFVALAHAAPAPPKAKTETAIFAGGCFWCMEHDMQAIPGVVSVLSGYTGGHVDHPTYGDVTSETSGHYESVKVDFDPSRISYADLMRRYWKLVDPTDDGGQFCDRGPSYRPAVFVLNPMQRQIAEQTKAEAAKMLKSGTMKTPILDAKTFWPAEEYHRNFAKNNAVHYNLYRAGCGRDARLAQIWGRPGA